MALSQNNPVTYADILAVKNAVDAAYVKTVGSTPSWDSFPIGVGALITGASMTQLNANGINANNRLVASVASYANNGNCSNNSNTWSAGFSTAYRYSKCGGGLMNGLDLDIRSRSRFSNHSS